MHLLIMFGLLVGPCVLLTLVEKIYPKFKMTNPTKFRLGLTIMFLYTAMGHFTNTSAMARMVPDIFPNREMFIFLSGFPQLLGAFAIWIDELRKLAGALLLAMLLGLLPFNIFASINHVEFAGHSAGPIYLLIRVPFQIFAMWWVYVSAELTWFVPRTEQY